MGTLFRYLPPFSSDYSGAASVLFELGGLTVFLDPGCCAYTYTSYEERRRQEDIRGVASAQLRMMDVILGADDVLADQVLQLIEEVEPPFVALLGTPVPALIGMDVPGVAEDISARCATPVIGIDTTGFDWYDVGIRKVYDALFALCTPEEGVGRTHPMNVLGLTPLDIGDEDNARQMMAALAEYCPEGCPSIGMEHLPGSFQRIGDASSNLVVSSVALPLARRLEERFGVPYVVRCPLGILDDAPSSVVPMDIPSNGNAGKRALVVAEQVMGHSLACKLRECGFEGVIEVASFFFDDELAEDLGTQRLGNESDLIAMLEAGSYDALVADPLILGIPEAKSIPLRLPFVHRAISGSLFRDDEVSFVGSEAQDRYVDMVHTLS